MVLRESYITPFGIKALALTGTANHITGRTLVFITNENKLYMVPQSGYSARRPHADQIKPEAGWFTLPDPEALDKEEVEPSMELQLKNKFY